MSGALGHRGVGWWDAVIVSAVSSALVLAGISLVVALLSATMDVSDR